MERLLEIGLSNAVLAAVLAVLAALVAAVWRRPALAHGLWLLVLLKLLTPPLVPVSLPWPGTGAPAAADDVLVMLEEDAPLLLTADAWIEPAEEDATETPPPEMAAVPAPAAPELGVASLDLWKRVAVIVWMTGAAAWLSLALVRIRRFAHLLRHARPASPEVRDEAAALAARLGLRGCPRVELLPGVVSPMLWTWLGSPRLLLPEMLLDRLSREQRETLLLHELAHLCRGDHWIRLLELLATALYWWHPIVWWARHELREAEEQCCDAWVVWTLPQAARAYAAALLETVDFLSEVRVVLPPAASGIGHVSLLKRRLTMIMQANTPRALSWAGFLALLGLAVVWLPTWVRADPPEEREKIMRELKQLRAKVQDEKVVKELDRLMEQLRTTGTDGAQKRFIMLFDGASDKAAQDQRRQAEDAAAKARAQQGEQVKQLEQRRREIVVQLADGKDEEVQRMLKKLQGLLMEKADKEKPRTEADSEELKKAKEEFAAAQQQLKEAQRRLNEASQRLAKVTVKHGTVLGIGPDGIVHMEIDGKKLFVAPRNLAPPTPPRPFVKAPPAPAAPGDSDKRISELEKRLSELLREVKGLRQEMQQQGPKPKPAKPTGAAEFNLWMDQVGPRY